MDCTHCEPVLLDLCYGELSPVQEREVRAHVADCPNCRKALARLEAGQALARHLADEAPPSELTERIMQAARAHVRRSASPFERLQAWIEAMARLAMTRQFAMATLSLLIVVVGVWSVPQLTGRREPQHAGEVMLEASSEEAAPSRAVASSPQPTAALRPTAAAPEPTAEVSPPRPAERPADARKKSEEIASRRSQRARGESSSRERELPQPMASKPGRFAAPPPAELAENKAKGAPAKSAPASKLDQPREAATAEAEQLALRDPAPVARSGGAALDDAIGAAAPPKPARAAAVEKAAPATAAAEPALAAAQAKPAQAAAAPAAPAVATAPGGPVGLDEMFQAGVERYRAEDYAGAAQSFARMLESSAPSGQRAAALLYLARSERALGRCDRAIRSYETLVRSYGSAQQSASALTEGVACYDQLGDAAGASRLIEHAASVPSLATQAQKMLHERGGAAKPRNP